MTDSIDVLGIGNAIVDILCFVGDEVVHGMGLAKGMMELVDENFIRTMEKSANPVSYKSGGSVANSLAHIAELGGSCQFVGKVANDKTGKRFSQDLASLGVKFKSDVLLGNESSGCCYIFVTPDGQRTMCTFPGAASMLTELDIDLDGIRNADYLLAEGYLWYSPSARRLILESSKFAKKVDTPVAFSLSDPLLVKQFRSELQDYVEEYVDIVIGNEHEAEQLYCTKGIESTLEMLATKARMSVVTRGALGSVVSLSGTSISTAAYPVTIVIDTTGAGDAYAAGFLFGMSKHKSLEQCMEIASKLAAEAIQHVGGRPH